MLYPDYWTDEYKPPVPPWPFSLISAVRLRLADGTFASMPVADQVYRLRQDTQLSISLSGPSVWSLTGAEHGLLQATGSGFTYEPMPGYTGLDCITFQSYDENGMWRAHVFSVEVEPSGAAALPGYSITTNSSGATFQPALLPASSTLTYPATGPSMISGYVSTNAGTAQ